MKIAEAFYSEHHTHHGTAGDQNGKEVRITDWRNFGYTKVLRCKDPEKADKIAKLAEMAARNKHVGYDQSRNNGRWTLFNEALIRCFQINRIRKNVECDCSSLVYTCVYGAGYTKIKRDGFTTNNMVSRIWKKPGGSFYLFTKKKYLDGTENLKRGDILVRKGVHTAIVL